MTFFLSCYEFPEWHTHFWSLPLHPPSDKWLNTLATVIKATPDLHPTMQIHLFPTAGCRCGSALQIFMCTAEVELLVCPPKHNFEHCQGWLLDITSHQPVPNLQISSGLEGSQEQSFSERTIPKHPNQHGARLPLRQEGHFNSFHATVLQLAAAPPSSHAEHKKLPAKAENKIQENRDTKLFSSG